MKLFSSETRSRKRPRNRKVKNRRGGNQPQLIEVRVRERTLMVQRRKWILTQVCKMILFTTVIGGLYIGGRTALDRLFYNNPRYYLQEIDASSDGVLAPGEIIAASQLEHGANLYSIKLEEVRKALESMAQVQSATVERQLPDRIVVRIIERHPVAWIIPEGVTEDLFTAEGAFMVDGRGILLKPHRVLPSYLHLPLVYGVPTTGLRAGQSISTVELKAALELLRLHSMMPLQAQFEIQKLDLSKGYCMVVSDRRQAQVTFGLEKIQEQADRLQALLNHCEAKSVELQTANLMLHRNVPVTFVQTSESVEVAATTPPKAGVRKGASSPPVRKAVPVSSSNSKKTKRNG